MVGGGNPLLTSGAVLFMVMYLVWRAQRVLGRADERKRKWTRPTGENWSQRKRRRSLKRWVMSLPVM